MNNQIFYQNKQIINENFVADICFDYFNERIRVDDYRGNVKALLHFIEIESTVNQFTKIIIKTKLEDCFVLQQNGYVKEAEVPKYFSGNNMSFYTKYHVNDRRNSEVWIEEDDMIKQITSSSNKWAKKEMESGYL